MCRIWLERTTGARCYALSAWRLSLPWDDGDFCWKYGELAAAAEPRGAPTAAVGPGRRRRRARGQLAAGRCWGSAPAAVLEIIEFGTTGQVAGFIAKAIQVRFIYTNGSQYLLALLSLVQH